MNPAIRKTNKGIEALVEKYTSFNENKQIFICACLHYGLPTFYKEIENEIANTHVVLMEGLPNPGFVENTKKKSREEISFMDLNT